MDCGRPSGRQGLGRRLRIGAFFAFHCVNAWEESSGEDSNAVEIILDAPAYENLDILKWFYYENMNTTAPGSQAYVNTNRLRARPQMTRWKLGRVIPTTKPPSTTPQVVERVFTITQSDTMELPTFSTLFAMKPSRYIYGRSDCGESTFLDGLIKLDTQTCIAKHWNAHAQSPGEPIFVPDPQGTTEDDGALLSVVLDGNTGTSYLLVLDAKTLVEIGRANINTPFPFGFHGTHAPR